MSQTRYITLGRHAQQQNVSTFNKALQLTPEGLAAAVNLGKQLKDRGFTFCATSTAVRAHMTTVEISSRLSTRAPTRGFDELWIDLSDEAENEAFWKLLHAVGDKPLNEFDAADENGYLRQHANEAWNELQTPILDEPHLFILGHLPTVPALARKIAEELEASPAILKALNELLLGKLDLIVLTIEDQVVVKAEHVPFVMT